MFFSPPLTQGTDIWALRERTGLFRKENGEPVQLTTGPMNFRSPVSSIDGKRLFVIGEQPRGELLRFESKSGQFVPYLGGISARDVDVSKDGEWVTYVSYPQGVLWRSRVDGSQRLQLSSLPMRAWLPRWSSDGKRIAFSAGVPGEPDRIYVVAADGGRPAQLTARNHYETDPNWSPDQNSLMIRGEPWFEGSVDIQLFDLKTRQVSTLPGSEDLFSPHWSPDGRYVVAMSRDSRKLMLFDFSTHKWAELVSSPAAYPNWSHDGSYIYFSNPYIAEPAVYRVRISDRKLELVASLSRQRLGWSIAGKWMGLAGDDSPLVLRDTGSEEIYALDWEAPWNGWPELSSNRSNICRAMDSGVDGAPRTIVGTNIARGSFFVVGCRYNEVLWLETAFLSMDHAVPFIASDSCPSQQRATVGGTVALRFSCPWIMVISS